MKRAKSSPAKMRMSLELPAQDGAVLERLAESTGGTKTEIIKRAIALMDTALAAKAKGRTLAVAAGDKLVSTIIL
jgi:hypothetical protein